MAKKVKSFAVDEEIYEAVSGMFKQNYVDVNISYCLNKYLKELLTYLRAIENELNRTPELDVTMSFIIDSITRNPLFEVLDSTPAPGMAESPLRARVLEFQGKYDTNVKKYPDQVAKYDVGAIDDNVPSAKVIKYIVKAVIEELTTKGPVPDDRHTELARETGGKSLQKKFREKIVPVLNKIDPVIEKRKKEPGIKGT
ncbi:MAG: hypothetical protein C0399_06765 [Syntrophus sp. (in: bacteria)]|nr:hypothetical protein [Syntrophus sp. (in: bacteria)]